MRYKKEVLLLFLTIIVSIIFIEILLRQIDHQQYTMNSIITLTDYSVYSYKPNIEFNYKSNEVEQEIMLNSMGLRDKEYGNKGKKRIAMLGDSFIAAFQVPLDKTVSKQLEKNLDGDYEVISMGLSAFGLTAEKLYFEREGIKLKPDILILNIYAGNDLTDIDGMISQYAPDKPPIVARIKHFLHQNFFTYTFLEKTKRSIDLKPFDYTVFTDDLAENILKLEENLNDFKEIAENEKIPLIVVIIPTREQVDDDLFDNMEKQLEVELDMTRPQDIIKELAVKNKIETLDLLPELRKRNGKNSFYFDLDGHWNEQGHEVAADILKEYVMEADI